MSLVATGLRDPTEDVEFQEYLLGDAATTERYHTAFRRLADTHRMHITMEGAALQRLCDGEWKDFPPAAQRVLLLEHVHLQYMHIGAPKLYNLLRHKFYWPNMKEDCSRFVRNCF